MTPTQVVPLVLFTIQFFFLTLGLYILPVARSLFRPRYVFIANLLCTFQALQHFFFFKVFSHRFHFEPCNKKSKNFFGQGMVRAALIFSQWTFVPVVESSQWLPRSLFLPGISLQLPGLPLLLFFCKHVSFWQFSDCRSGSDLSGQVLPLKWGGTSHLVPPHRGAVRRGGHQTAKAQVRQCSGQPA